jgi:hypothetical protein
MRLCLTILAAGSLLVALTGAAQDEVVPDALVKMDQGRRHLQTGMLNYSEEAWWGEPERPAHYFNHTTGIFAGNDRIVVQRGDEEGVVRRTADGQPGESGPIRTLFGAGRLWRNEEARYHAEAYARETPNTLVADLRALGTSGGFFTGGAEYVSPWVLAGPSQRTRYHEDVENGLAVVTAEREDGWTQQWWIDPQRGWQPVRSRLVRPDGGWQESRSALKSFDGIWYPEKVQYYDSAWKGGKEAENMFRIFQAEFNRADQPRTLTPADIGITPGTALEMHDRNQLPIPGEAGFFDGRDVVPMSQYLAQRAASHEAALKQPGAATQPVGDPNACAGRIERMMHFESEWEAYTRRFIEKYQLDADQTTKARQVLSTCQTHANAYMTRRKGDIEKLQKELAGLKDLETSQRAAKAAAVADVLEKLGQPIEQIFERQLKPHLESLPTRKQRAAAEGGATSKGSGP